MTCLPCAVALFLTALPAEAAVVTTPNSLTAEETAEGWVLLFDGRTPSGWYMDGDAEVKDGALLLGGARVTRARFPRPLGCPFNLRFEYQERVPAPTGTEVRLALRPRGVWSRGGDAETISQASTDWVEVVLAATYDRGQDRYEETSKFLVLPASEFNRGGGTTTQGLGPPRHAQDLWLEVPAGARVAVRNVKFKGENVLEATALWIGLLPLIALLLLALGIVAFVAIRRCRRPVAAGAVLGEGLQQPFGQEGHGGIGGRDGERLL